MSDFRPDYYIDDCKPPLTLGRARLVLNMYPKGSSRAISIYYALLEGSPTYDFGRESLSGRWEILIRAEDVPNFMDWAIPRWSYEMNASSGYPAVYLDLPPKLAEIEELMIDSVSVEPFNGSRPCDPYARDAGKAGDRVAHTSTYGPYVKVTINWKSGSSLFIRDLKVHGGGEFLSIGSHKAKVQEKGVAGAGPITKAKDPQLGGYKVIPTSEYTYTLQPHLIKSFKRFTEVLGMVNAAPDPDLCDNAFTETVLFSGFSATKLFVSGTGLPIGGVGGTEPWWSIELKFTVHAVREEQNILQIGVGYVDVGPLTFGWNDFWSPDKQRWVTLYRDDEKTKMYQTANLASLLDYCTPTQDTWLMNQKEW